MCVWVCVCGSDIISIIWLFVASDREIKRLCASNYLYLTNVYVWLQCPVDILLGAIRQSCACNKNWHQADKLHYETEFILENEIRKPNICGWQDVLDISRPHSDLWLKAGIHYTTFHIETHFKTIGIIHLLDLFLLLRKTEHHTRL